MTNSRAIEVLKDYNEWRRGEQGPCDCNHSATEIGVAIDVACHALYQIDKIQQLVYFGKMEGGGQ